MTDPETTAVLSDLHYRDGRFVPTAPAWTDEHGDEDAWMAATGWRKWTKFGDPELGTLAIEVYIGEPLPAGGRPYLLAVTTGGDTYTQIRVDSLAGAMDLLSRWAPAVQTGLLSDLAARLDEAQIDDLSPFGLIEKIAAKAAFGVENMPDIDRRERHSRAEARARRKAKAEAPQEEWPVATAPARPVDSSEPGIGGAR